MRSVRLLMVLVCAMTLSVLPVVSATADEHPEHPEKAGEHAEHPEHPEEAVELSKDSLADAIEMVVASFSQLQGGQFCVFDTKNKEALALTLDKVHRERLSGLGNGLFFACADFKATNGKMYDVDIFMKQVDGGLFNGLMPEQVTVHKQEGKARYSWYEEAGSWKMKNME